MITYIPHDIDVRKYITWSLQLYMFLCNKSSCSFETINDNEYDAWERILCAQTIDLWWIDNPSAKQ